MLDSWPPGYIGDSLIAKQQCKDEARRQDIRGIGLVAIELAEPTTSALDPAGLALRFPEHWAATPDIIAFIANTATHSLQDLLRHSFLAKAFDSGYFSKYAVLASREVAIPIQSL